MKNKTSAQKKIEIIEQIENMDSNNLNILKKPIVKRRGKKVHDDGFEHRTSEETAK